MDNRINNFHLPLVTEQIEIPMENESILGDSNDTKENNNNHHPSKVLLSIKLRHVCTVKKKLYKN